MAHSYTYLIYILKKMHVDMGILLKYSYLHIKSVPVFLAVNKRYTRTA